MAWAATGSSTQAHFPSKTGHKGQACRSQAAPFGRAALACRQPAPAARSVTVSTGSSSSSSTDRDRAGRAQACSSSSKGCRLGANPQAWLCLSRCRLRTAPRAAPCLPSSGRCGSSGSRRQAALALGRGHPAPRVTITSSSTWMAATGGPWRSSSSSGRLTARVQVFHSCRHRRTPLQALRSRPAGATDSASSSTSKARGLPRLASQAPTRLGRWAPTALLLLLVPQLLAPLDHLAVTAQQARSRCRSPQAAALLMQRLLPRPQLWRLQVLQRQARAAHPLHQGPG